MLPSVQVCTPFLDLVNASIDAEDRNAGSVDIEEIETVGSSREALKQCMLVKWSIC